MQNKRADDYRASINCTIIEAALEYFVSIMVSGAYLARITGALGFSDSLTGVLSSVVSLGCLFQLGSVLLFKNARSAKGPVLGGYTLNQLLFVFVYLLPVLPMGAAVKTGAFFVCFCGAFAISNLIVPMKTDWFLGLVDDRSRGIFTAKKEIISLIGGMGFSFMMGRMIDTLEAAGNTAGAFIAGAVTLFVLTVLHKISIFPVKETPKKAAAESEKADIGALLRDKMFRRIVLVFILWNIASYSAIPFYGAYQIKELGFSMTFVSVLSIAYAVVRACCSPAMGRLADRKGFGAMVRLCFCIAAAGFFVNIFTVPENGRVFYMLYYCLNAAAMAGINSSISNLIFDHVHGPNRRSALAINSSVGGIAGFTATCVMSAVVAKIQQGGNSLMGMAMYPAQFVSAIAFIVTAAVAAYVHFAIVRPGCKE